VKISEAEMAEISAESSKFEADFENILCSLSKKEDSRTIFFSQHTVIFFHSIPYWVF